MFDTIAAISTPRGEGGIGIIRISGDDAINIINNIFISKNKKALRPFSVNYGHLYDKDILIDEVIVNYMKAPKTYTKEDIVEINCHGGYLISEKVLELVLKSGARLAEQGEFTKRAFINGRIDLSQAEAVMDIIHGKTSESISISLNHLRGDLKIEVEKLKKMLLDVAAHVNVILDYPEEGIDEPLPDKLKDNLRDVYKQCEELISSYNRGKIIKEGLKTVIVGKPNVGKSSILNSLLREERAIVTHIPGTTRDVIEEVINIKGIPLVLVDTAGIRDTQDIVENIGVKKSEEFIEKADLILFVLDSSREIDDEDLSIFFKVKDKNTIAIVNKIDISEVSEIEILNKFKKVIRISAKENKGIKEMEDEIYLHILNENINEKASKIIITNVRHKAALEKTKLSIDNIFETLSQNMPMDLIAIDLKEALDSLGEITGEISSEDLLDHVFSNFCVGK